MENHEFYSADSEHCGVPIHKDRGPPVHLYSGKLFYVLDPKVEDIELEDIAQSLSRTCRYNGHIEAPFYSVAQHCVLASMFVNGDAKMAKTALFHDATEAYIGDIVKPLKVLLPQIKEIEENLWKAISTKFDLNLEIPEEVHLVDRKLLSTEKRDFLPSSSYWGDLPEPFGFKIFPQGPKDSYNSFMWAYDKIMEKIDEDSDVRGY